MGFFLHLLSLLPALFELCLEHLQFRSRLISLRVYLAFLVHVSEMTSFLLDKTSQLEHKLETVLDDTLLLLALQLEQTCTHWVKLSSLVYFVTPFYFLLNPFNLRAQVAKLLLDVKFLDVELELHGSLRLLEHIYRLELLGEHLLSVFDLVLVSDLSRNRPHHRVLALVELAQLVGLQLLLGDLQLGLQVLLEQLRERLDEDELVLPYLDEALKHINDVKIVHLRAVNKQKSAER